MEITVVIPSKDTPTLAETLDSVRVAAQCSSDVRVNVALVDSSRDAPSIPEELERAARVVVIRKECGLLAARLEGYAVASGEWVLNLDADQSLHPALLASLTRSGAAAVVIPELPPAAPAWDRWIRLVHRAHERTDAAFRRQPSLRITVIPRAYRREAMVRAAAAIRRDVSDDLGRLPTRHEDTILFAYYLAVNGLELPSAIDFESLPIYHRVPPLEVAARKAHGYGRDLGSETRRMRRGELALDPAIWRRVYQAESRGLTGLWSRGLGWNPEGGTYNAFRACFYIPGFVTGFLSARSRGRAVSR